MVVTSAAPAPGSAQAQAQAQAQAPAPAPAPAQAPASAQAPAVAPEDGGDPIPEDVSTHKQSAVACGLWVNQAPVCIYTS